MYITIIIISIMVIWMIANMIAAKEAWIIVSVSHSSVTKAKTMILEKVNKTVFMGLLLRATIVFLQMLIANYETPTYHIAVLPQRVLFHLRPNLLAFWC